jgi:hypothetical protein
MSAARNLPCVGSNWICCLFIITLHLRVHRCLCLFTAHANAHLVSTAPDAAVLKRGNHTG